MAQIKDELEEAATASGASWLQSFRRVFIPLLMPSLLAAFLYTMIVAFREISAAIFLYTSGTEVVSVQVYDLYSNGSYPVVAALGVVHRRLPEHARRRRAADQPRVGIKTG